MAEYQDGREAQVGDLVSGPTNNRDGVTEGRVVHVDPSTEDRVIIQVPDGPKEWPRGSAGRDWDYARSTDLELVEAAGAEDPEQTEDPAAKYSDEEIEAAFDPGNEYFYSDEADAVREAVNPEVAQVVRDGIELDKQKAAEAEALEQAGGGNAEPEATEGVEEGGAEEKPEAETTEESITGIEQAGETVALTSETPPPSEDAFAAPEKKDKKKS